MRISGSARPDLLRSPRHLDSPPSTAPHQNRASTAVNAGALTLSCAKYSSVEVSSGVVTTVMPVLVRQRDGWPVGVLCWILVAKE
jgi:hypothetical protein